MSSMPDRTRSCRGEDMQPSREESTCDFDRVPSKRSHNSCFMLCVWREASDVADQRIYSSGEG
jgi:hypothetical protein